jgi:hypothetical protein
MKLYRTSNDMPTESDLSEAISPKIHKTKTSEKDSELLTTKVTDMLYQQEPKEKKIKIRAWVFGISLVLLFLGRFNVPDNDPPSIVDKVQDSLSGVNEFILNNPTLRNTLLILCSGFMDLMFLGTGAFWIMRGNSSRLVVSTLVFYIVRAIVQSFWYSPFPSSGYWWYDPGFPSLVVPYGKGSDFFFSGHIGFVTICAAEWKKTKNPLMATILTIGGIYTGFILLAYKVHYSIDIFTGVTFAHYVYIMVDSNKEKIDSFLIEIYYKIKGLFEKSSMALHSPKDSEHEFL